MAGLEVKRADSEAWSSTGEVAGVWVVSFVVCAAAFESGK
jgi:hypothetical protein